MESTKHITERTHRWMGNLLFFLQVLLILLWFFREKLVIPPSMTWMGRMHALVVHFPITLLLLLAIAWFFRHMPAASFFSDNGQRLLIFAAALMSTVAAISGYLIAASGSYDQAVLDTHRNFGTLTALGAYLVWIIHSFSGTKLAYAIGILMTTAAMVIAGHWGGSLTHGEDFLFRENEQTTQTPILITDSTPVFEASIRPILESKCYTCHNEKKSKGDFVMSTIEGLLRGGKNGAPWVAGDPANSLLVQRLLLDMGDRKHMPPKGKPQLTAQHIELIRYWIHRGADMKIDFRSLSARDSLWQMAQAALPVNATTVKPPTQYDFKAPDPSVVARLQSPYSSLLPVYRGAPAYALSFFLKQGFDAARMRAYEPVRQHIVSLNLSNMPVSDSILSEIGKFSNLETLNLSGTSITGKGLSSLANLKKLRVLSLSGTRVTATELEALRGMNSLEKVFLWQTPIDDDALANLKKAMPAVQWDMGSRADPSEKLRLTPPQLGIPDKFIFHPGERLTLAHPMKGAIIRYTIDGSDPDSAGATRFDTAIQVGAPLTVKAIAVMNGWYASAIQRFDVFPAGLKPLRTTLLSQPDPKYRQQGGESLFDEQKGDPANLLVHWLGYREGPMRLHVVMDGNQDISQVIVSAGISHNSYVFPPLELEVRAGMDSGRWETRSVVRPAQPSGYGPQQNLACILSLPKRRWKHLDITVKPVPALPSWHSGKKQKAWVFVDEIFIR